MVHDVVAGFQEFLKHETTPIEYFVDMKEPQVSHVANAAQDTQHQLAAQLQNMHTIMQEIQLQYAAAQHPAYQDWLG